METFTFDIDIEGNTIPVTFTSDNFGIFSADIFGEHFEADGLSSLRGQLRACIATVRFELPFVALDGTRGIVRGWHAGNGDALVTYEDGRKGRMENYTRIFRASDVTDAEVARIRELCATVDAALAELYKLRNKTTDPTHLVAEHIGHEMSTYGGARELSEALSKEPTDA